MIVKVGGKHYRTVWMEGSSVFFIEQNLLPFEFRIEQSENFARSCHAIRTMQVRGAGAIGALAGFAMAQAFIEAETTGNPALILRARAEIESKAYSGKPLLCR